MRLFRALLLHIPEYFCRFMSENTWSKGASSTKSTSFVRMNEHPFVCVKEHPLLIQEKIRICITSRISEKNFALLKKKKGKKKKSDMSFSQPVTQ